MRDSSSQSRQLLARFIGEFVDRYKRRQTILFYELTNELNLDADLDLHRRCRAGVNACVLGNFTTADMTAFSRDLVPFIKSIDPSRLISSGYAVPRRPATHLARKPEFSLGGPDWTPDTPDEFGRYLLTVH